MTELQPSLSMPLPPPPPSPAGNGAALEDVGTTPTDTIAARAKPPPGRSFQRQMSEASAEAWHRAQVISAKQEEDVPAPSGSGAIPLNTKSLWLFAPTHPLRVKAWCVVHAEKFNYFVLVVVLFATVLLIMAPSERHHHDHDDGTAHNHHRLDSCSVGMCGFVYAQFLIGVFFTFEAMLKMIALGVVGEPGAYLRNGHTDRLDACVVIFFWVDIIIEHTIESRFVSLAAFRMLRLLSVAPRIKAFQQINDLFLAVSTASNLLFNVLGVLLFGLTIFGVLGIQSFQESLSRQCVAVATGVSMIPRAGCKTDVQCPQGFACRVGQSVGFGQVSFDHMGRALLVLFQVVSKDDWANQIMSPLKQAEPDYTKGLWVYFDLLSIFVVFLSLNLFVAVLVSNFSRVRALRREREEEAAQLRHSGSATSGGRVSWYDKVWACACCPGGDLDTPPSVLRARLGAMVTTRTWQWCVAIAIAINTLALALEHDGMDDAWEVALLVIEWIFNAFFLVEVTVRLFALGPRRFFQDGENQFDFVLVYPPIIAQIVLTGIGVPSRKLSAVRAFRVTRLLRYVPKLWKLCESLLRSKWGMINLLIFYIIASSSLAVLGVQLFGTVPTAATDNYVTTFKTYGRSMLSIFHIATGHAWVDIQYRYMAVGENNVFGWPGPVFSAITSIYFVSVFIICNFVFINLFIAVILENYALQDKEVDRVMRRVMTILTPRGKHLRPLVADEEEVADVPKLAPASGRLLQRRGSKTNLTVDPQIKAVDGKVSAPRKVWNAYRRLFQPLKQYKGPFYKFVYVVIVLSAVLLAITGPASNEFPVLPRQPTIVLDLIIAIFFLLEFVIRLGWDGVAFFTVGWNLLDMLILFLTVVDQGLLWGATKNSVSFDFARVFRLLRCLRPLRMLNRNVSMKIIVNGLISSFSTLFYVILLFFVFTFVFAIMGNQLFRGRLVHCNADVSGLDSCVGVAPRLAHPDLPRGPKLLFPRVWDQIHPSANFDTVAYSALTLFRASTLEWTDTLAALTSLTGKDQQPAFNSNPYNAWFLMSFMFLSTLLIINLFVTVVVEYFKASASYSLVTRPQKQWLATTRLLYTARLYVLQHPVNKVRCMFYRVCTHEYFEHVVTISIALNGICMIIQHKGQSDAFTQVLLVADYLFLVMFTLELVIKVVAMGRRYLRSKFNTFDAFIILCSWISVGIERQVPFMAKFSRMLRVMRLFRFVAVLPTLRTLAETLWASLSSFFNIILLILLMFWMFSVLGVQLFGDVRSAYRVGHVAHLNGFFVTMQSLFQIISGDDWDALMDDLNVRPPSCTLSGTDGVEFGDCGPYMMVTFLYFVIYMIVALFVAVNLFVAVVLENFSHFSEVIPPMITPDDVARFKQIWIAFDTNQNGKIPIRRLRPLLDRLAEPLVDVRPNFSRTFYHAVRADLMNREAQRQQAQRSASRSALVSAEDAEDDGDDNDGADIVAGAKAMLQIRTTLGDFEVSAEDVMGVLLAWSTPDVCYTNVEVKRRAKKRNKIRPVVGMQVLYACALGMLTRRRHPQLKRHRELVYGIQAHHRDAAARSPPVPICDVEGETRLRAGQLTLADLWTGGTMESERLRSIGGFRVPPGLDDDGEEGSKGRKLWNRAKGKVLSPRSQQLQSGGGLVDDSGAPPGLAAVSAAPSDDEAPSTPGAPAGASLLKTPVKAALPPLPKIPESKGVSKWDYVAAVASPGVSTWVYGNGEKPLDFPVSPLASARNLSFPPDPALAPTRDDAFVPTPFQMPPSVTPMQVASPITTTEHGPTMAREAPVVVKERAPGTMSDSEDSVTEAPMLLNSTVEFFDIKWPAPEPSTVAAPPDEWQLSLGPDGMATLPHAANRQLPGLVLPASLAPPHAPIDVDDMFKIADAGRAAALSADDALAGWADTFPDDDDGGAVGGGGVSAGGSAVYDIPSDDIPSDATVLSQRYRDMTGTMVSSSSKLSAAAGITATWPAPRHPRGRTGSPLTESSWERMLPRTTDHGPLITTDHGPLVPMSGTTPAVIKGSPQRMAPIWSPTGRAGGEARPPSGVYPTPSVLRSDADGHRPSPGRWYRQPR